MVVGSIVGLLAQPYDASQLRIEFSAASIRDEEQLMQLLSFYGLAHPLHGTVGEQHMSAASLMRASDQRAVGIVDR